MQNLERTYPTFPTTTKSCLTKFTWMRAGRMIRNRGTFTCKEPGIYVFDWTILTHFGKDFHTDLMVDGVVRGRLHLNAGNTKNRRSGSNMVVVKLKPGNKVWVEPHTTHVGQFAYSRWSSFSGFKLWWMNLFKYSTSNKENILYLCFCHSNSNFLQEFYVQWFLRTYSDKAYTSPHLFGQFFNFRIFIKFFIHEVKKTSKF